MSWSQIVTGSGRYAFTEQGVAMLSSVLNSKRAILVNIQIVRTFIRLRQMVATNGELAAKLAELERKMESHDQSIRSLFEAIRSLIEPPLKESKKIGFSMSKRQVGNRGRGGHNL